MSSRNYSVLPSLRTISERAVETEKSTGIVAWGVSLARWPGRSAKMVVFVETCLLMKNTRQFSAES